MKSNWEYFDHECSEGVSEDTFFPVYVPDWPQMGHFKAFQGFLLCNSGQECGNQLEA